MRLFTKPGDFHAFEGLLAETLGLRPLRICGFCLMPTHFGTWSYGRNWTVSWQPSCSG
jgi:hypothetical protein